MVYLTYMFHKNQSNVGKYTSPMDPIDNESLLSGIIMAHD